MRAEPSLFSSRILRYRRLASAVAGGLLASMPITAKAAWTDTATKAFPVAGATTAGYLDRDEAVQVLVALKLRNTADLDRRISDLQTRRSNQPGLVMTSSEVANQFAPTAEQAHEVARYLTQSGFSRVHVSDNNLLVTAKGTAASVQKAFNTAMVHVMVNGKMRIANVSAAQVPVYLRDVVQSVLGLQTVQQMHTLLVPGKIRPPCITPPGVADCGGNGNGGISYDPISFATFYGGAGLPSAASTSVGIIAEGNLLPTITDLHTFEQTHGLAVLNPSVVLAGTASNDVRNQDEWNLDSQVVQGVADSNLKNIVFYVATALTNPDLTSAFNVAVSSNAVKAINVSLGECELAAKTDGSAVADDQIFQLAIVQGQTFSVSSGDYGSNECGNGSQGDSYPASSPYVISVGGTTLTVAHGATSEVAWIGGGGGPSQFEPRPAWQADVITGPARGVPDLAFDADSNTGVRVIINGSVLVYGGTSLSSPIFVGLFARLESSMNNSLPFPAAWIYHFPTGARTGAFHDIVSGSNGGYQATVGWDYTTGWGSIVATNVKRGLDILPLAPILTYILNN